MLVIYRWHECFPFTSAGGIVAYSAVTAHLGLARKELSGHDLTYWGVEYKWGKMREALGFSGEDEFVIHALRHTFCSRLAAASVPIHVIKELAARQTIDITMRYMNSTSDQLVAAVQHL